MRRWATVLLVAGVGSGVVATAASADQWKCGFYECYHQWRITRVTASYTATIPAHHSGVIQWAPVFTSRRKVQQRQWTCRYSKYGFHTCNKDPNNVFRDVYTEKYSHPRFRVRYHG